MISTYYPGCLEQMLLFAFIFSIELFETNALSEFEQRNDTSIPIFTRNLNGISSIAEYQKAVMYMTHHLQINLLSIRHCLTIGPFEPQNSKSGNIRTHLHLRIIPTMTSQ